MAADERVGPVHAFDHGLPLAAMPLGDLVTEDDREFVRLADCAVGVEQALAGLSKAACR